MKSLASLLAIVVMSAVCLLRGCCGAEQQIYFEERFEDGESGYKARWVESTFKGDEQGLFKLSAGKFFGDAQKSIGLQTTQDARFYGASAKFPSAFSNEGKSLVIQFSVKHEQSIDCGGGYVKLFPSTLDQAAMHGESPYLIMFGPDICGFSTKKVHVIFNYKGKNLLIKKDIKCKDDDFTHLYTLIVNADNTYVVKIDNEQVESGKLEEDWDFLAPKRIADPAAKKPADWEDNEKIDDPADTKPEDWDKPEFIPDPEAKRPDDWDEEMDGEWQPPKIDNPEFKGEWKVKQIDNPKYKGAWVHPEIDNPDYTPDDKLYRYADIGAIGFDLWQVKSGTIFDNVLVTDSEAFAEKVGAETLGLTKDGEKKAKDAHDEEQRKADEAAKKSADSNKDADKDAEEKLSADDDEEEPASSEKDEL